jgi:glycosyltransferase involved in cell wall biosynthesis
VIHAYNPTMALAAGLATRRPGLVNLQGVAEEDWPATVRLVRLSRLAPVACGPGVAAALEEQGLPPFATVPNAVGPAPPPGERVADVVAVGRLVEQKNHELAIRAITQVPGATLAIVGDGPLRPELERLAGDLGAQVIFAGVRRDARALMGAADVVVMPSRWEGLPLSALEALASGTPLVATNVRGLRELLTDGENALLVPEDPDALATAIRRVLEDDTLAARLSQAGRQVEGAGSDEALVAGFLAVYERLAA